MNHAHAQTHTNGHAKQTWKTFDAHEVKKLVAGIDLDASVRKHPWRSIAIAGAVGGVIGLTMGSKAMRLLVGSVGMYTLTDVLQRYAKQALSDAA